MIVARQTVSASAPNCCSLPAAGGGGGGPAPAMVDPPAGGWMDLNATQCSALLKPGTPYCDKGYSSAGGGGSGLRLANRTLNLRQVVLAAQPRHWFWDLVTLAATAASGGPASAAPGPVDQLVLLACLLLVGGRLVRPDEQPS